MTYHPCSAEMSRKSRALTYLEPLGPPRPVAGDLYLTLNAGLVHTGVHVSFNLLMTSMGHFLLMLE